MRTRRAHALWVDHDFDRNLKNEKRVWLKPTGTTFTRSQVILVTYPGDEKRTRAELRFTYMPPNGDDYVAVYPLVHRRGTVVLGGRLRLIALTDGSSDLRFNDPKRDKLYIDLDGDGRFATTGDAPERVIQGEPFRVGEEGWIAEVTDISGRAVTFTRAAEVPPRDTADLAAPRRAHVRREAPGTEGESRRSEEDIRAREGQDVLGALRDDQPDRIRRFAEGARVPEARRGEGQGQERPGRRRARDGQRGVR